MLTPPLTIDLVKDLVMPKLLPKRKKKPITKLRLMVKPLCLQVQLMRPLLMKKLELSQKPRLLPPPLQLKLTLKELPKLINMMVLSITGMALKNSLMVDSLMAPTCLLQAKLPSKMKMVKSMRLLILLELSLTPKFINSRTNKANFFPSKDKKLTRLDSLTPTLILMASTMPKMVMLNSSKVEHSVV